MRFELIAKTDEKIILKYSKRGRSLNRYKENIESLKYLESIGIDCKNKVLLNRFIPKSSGCELLFTNCNFHNGIEICNIKAKSITINKSDFKTIKIDDYKGDFEACNINVHNKLEIDECNINNFTLKNSRIEQDFILTNSNIKGCINLDKTTFLKPELAIIDFNGILNYTKDDMLTLINNNQITQEELYRTIIKLDNIAKACNDSFYANKIHKTTKLIKCIMSENDIKTQDLKAKEIAKEDKNKGMLKNIQIWGLVVLNSKNYIDEFLSDFNTSFVKNLNAIVGLIIVFGILNLLAYIFINFDVFNIFTRLSNPILNMVFYMVSIVVVFVLAKINLATGKTYAFILFMFLLSFTIANIFYFPLFLLILFIILYVVYFVISKFKKYVYFLYLVVLLLSVTNSSPLLNIFKLDFLPKYTQETLNEIPQNKLKCIVNIAFVNKEEDNIYEVFNTIRDFFMKPPKHINDYKEYILNNKYKILAFANEVPEKNRDEHYYKIFKSLYIDIQFSLTYCILYILLLISFISLSKTWERN